MPHPAPLSQSRAYVLLHATIVVWGFTAILGKLISVNAFALVWYRQWIAALVLLGAAARSPRILRLPGRDVLALFLVAALVSFHWVCFYGAIKAAGVAVAVVCLATTSFFVALVEPIVFRRKLRVAECVLGLVVLVGVVLLVSGEAHADAKGIALGIGSAVGAALFGTLNGALVKRISPVVMSVYELGFGATWLSLCFAIVPESFVAPLAMSRGDAGWLLILAVVCTAIPWLTSLRAMHALSPFTVALSINLEPVYTLIIAWFVFPSSERLSVEFYVGTALLIAAVGVNARLKAAEKPAGRNE